MADFKFANWNIEWMNRWFTGDSDGAPQLRPQISGVADVAELATRAANVITEIDADVITIQEGPSRLSEMALFVSNFLGSQYTVYGPAGKGQQKLYTLVNNDSQIVQNAVAIDDEHGIDFDDAWDVDVDGDMVPDGYYFTRPPLVLLIDIDGDQGQRQLRSINLHTKSKYVHNGRSMWENPARRQEFIELALKARRRISAEAMRVRTYINRILDQSQDAPLIVSGDLNDGPGLDFFEQTYLTHNVAGLIAGSPYAPRRMLRHTFVDLMPEQLNYTAEFFDFVEGRDKQILLDHIFVSPGLFWHGNDRIADGRIEHDIFNNHIRNDLNGRAQLPSDHRPQSVTIQV
ncbi:MAG: hypothetical protein MI746_14810 [Pseudomonadales bacterium]|nr:hypothetical protein [Pseudomonadales bacterium]